MAGSNSKNFATILLIFILLGFILVTVGLNKYITNNIEDNYSVEVASAVTPSVKTTKSSGNLSRSIKSVPETKNQGMQSKPSQKTSAKVAEPKRIKKHYEVPTTNKILVQ